MTNRGCGCKSPTNQRITPDGYVEQSFDGGLTWFRVGTDERFNNPIFPPLVGPVVGTIPCAGAKSGTEAMRIVIEQFTNESLAWETILGLLTLLIGVLSVLLGPFGVAVTGVITALVWILYNFGKAAFVAHDWPAELDKYLCILFCNIEDDASFTEAGWQKVKADIVAQMAGIAETYFWNMVNSLGPVGLTNAARIFPSLAGDCSQCDCGECTDPTLVPGQPGIDLLDRSGDLGAGWWSVMTQDWTAQSPGCAPNGCFMATINIAGCCLHSAYVIVPPGTNAPPGNRQGVNCEGVSGFANYGLGGCVEAIVFRSYEVAEFQFKLETCV